MKKRSRKSKRAGKKTKSQGKGRESLKNLGELSVSSEYKTNAKPPDDIRMSEIILTLAEPLLQKYGKNFQRAHGILTLAVTVWNLTMLPEPDEEQIVAEITNGLPQEFSAEDVAVLLQTIYMLMRRKQELFQDIQRIIVKLDLRETENGFDLTAFSAPVPGTFGDSLTDTIPV